MQPWYMHAAINLELCSSLLFTRKGDQKRYASTGHEHSTPLPQGHADYPVQRDLDIHQDIMSVCYIDDTVLFGT